MMELNLFSEQLGHIAAVAAFLGSNSWFGLLEAVDLNPSTETSHRVWTYLYVTRGRGLGGRGLGV